MRQKFQRINLSFLHVCVFCGHVEGELSACGTCGTQKIIFNPLELELQMIVSHHVAAENQAQVLCKTSQHS